MTFLTPFTGEESTAWSGVAEPADLIGHKMNGLRLSLKKLPVPPCAVTTVIFHYFKIANWKQKKASGTCPEALVLFISLGSWPDTCLVCGGANKLELQSPKKLEERPERFSNPNQNRDYDKKT